MSPVSQQQASKQWEAITPQLREALFSDVNANLVWSFCQTEHLSKETSYRVAEFAGYVLFGFIRPEDLSEELIESLSLSPESAQKISDEINAKIFAPLRVDIDKAYATALGKEENIISPKIIQGVGSAAVAATIPLPPQNLSGTGWSKVKLPPTPPQNQNAMGEFERMKSTSSAAIPVPTPTPILAPVMLRQEMPAASASQKNADFRIAKSSETAQMQFSKEKEQTKVMPAIIEFNKNIAPATKSATPTPPPAPNRPGAVNYTEFKSSLASLPVANSSARNISEITSAPKPTPVPMPPAPPTINKTPSAPFAPVASSTSTTPAAPKVIVQDFLDQTPKQ